MSLHEITEITFELCSLAIAVAGTIALIFGLYRLVTIKGSWGE